MSRNGAANDLLNLWKENATDEGFDYSTFDSQFILESIEKMDTTFSRRRIAELEAENKQLRDDLAPYDEDMTKQIFLCKRLRKRAEQAEAERDSWKMTAEQGCSLAESYKTQLAALGARHAVEVTGILRSMMGYMTALTASSAEMVTFIAQKLEPYQDAADTARPTP
jgi:hypothetical protein